MTRAASPLDVAETSTGRSAFVAGAGATVVHSGLIAIAVFIGARVARRIIEPPAVTQLVDIELPPVPAPAKQEALAPAAVSKPVRRVAKPNSRAQSPAAAIAGEVVKAPDDAVDFGDRFFEGNGPGYAGGDTDRNGTSTEAVHEPPARGAGTPPPVIVAPPAIDRSRAPQLAGGSSWDCPFPVEADDADVDQAVVTLRIAVAADGRVLSATATRDPGHGFAREARRCALSKRWSAGLDRAGVPIESTTVVNVRFDR